MTSTAPGRPMRVTKYPQSCMVLERDGRRLAIDPGNVAMDAYAFDDLGPLEAVLFTHRHPDHLDERAVEAAAARGVALYGNADVCALLGAGRARQVDDGVALGIAGFEVLPRDLPHCPLIDGSPGPPNTGFEFDGRLLHPGDGIDGRDVAVEILAVPVAGPSISLRDAYMFVRSSGARTAVPMHYDVFPANLERFTGACDIAEVVVLGPGESVEL